MIDQFEHPFCLVTTVFESKEEAKNIARHLLSKKLIVSGQINTIQSLYFWDDKICSKPEYKLTCFIHSALYKAIQKFVITNHFYEVCEIICTPILNTSDMFGNWIQEYVKYEQEN